MKKILNHFRTTIYLVMCMLFTILIFAYVNEIFLSTSSTWLVCIPLIIAIVIVDYLSRLYVKNLISFFLIHLGIIGVGIAVPAELMDKIILGFIGLIFLIMAINFWKTDTNERHLVVIDIPFGAIIIFIIVYFHSSYFLSPALTTYAYVSGIVFFMLYFIREYLEKFFSYSMSSDNFSNELKHTFKTNISLLTLFNIAIVLLITTVNMFFSNSSFNIIGKFFRWIGRFIFGFFQRFDNTGGATEAPTQPPILEDATGETLVAHTSTSDGPNIGTLIFNALQIVLYIAIIVGILYLVYTFIKNYMHRNNETNDEVKSTDDVIRKSKVEHNTADKPKSSFFASNKDKIRKIFANQVNASTKKNSHIIIRKSFTSDQINSTLTKEEAVNKENMDTLTSLYKKARYSNSEITKEEVENAKKL